MDDRSPGRVKCISTSGLACPSLVCHLLPSISNTDTTTGQHRTQIILYTSHRIHRMSRHNLLISSHRRTPKPTRRVPQTSQRERDQLYPLPSKMSRTIICATMGCRSTPTPSRATSDSKSLHSCATQLVELLHFLLVEKRGLDSAAPRTCLRVTAAVGINSQVRY